MRIKLIVILLSVVSCFSAYCEEPAPSSNVLMFNLPKYPGSTRTVIGQEIHPGKSFLVYKYALDSGKAVEPEAVLTFYRKELGNRGWKFTERLILRKGELAGHYTNVFFNGDNDSYVRRYVRLKLWFAPAAGQFSLYVSDTHEARLGERIKKLQETARDVLGRVARDEKFSLRKEEATYWEPFFENEKLVDAESYWLIPEALKDSRAEEVGRNGMRVHLLTYTNHDVAANAVKILLKEFSEDPRSKIVRSNAIAIGQIVFASESYSESSGRLQSELHKAVGR